MKNNFRVDKVVDFFICNLKFNKYNLESLGGIEMNLEVRAISEKHNVKIAIVDLTDGFKEIVKLQKTNPLATVALGRVVANTTLLSLSIKDGDRLNVNINGMGYAGKIIAEFEENKFRGYVQFPNFDASQIDTEKGALSPLTQTVGTNGFMQVARYTSGNEPYVSRVELVTGEINVDFISYVQQSDQINTLLTSTVDIDENGNVNKLVGMLIQLLPNSREEDIDFIEEKIGSLDHLNKTLIGTTNYEALIKDICDDAKILGSSDNLEFACSCSNEKVIDSIRMLPKEEIDKIIEIGDAVEVTCDFCKKEYAVDVEEIKLMFN
jgi:molecular chaperone Hsp33